MKKVAIVLMLIMLSFTLTSCWDMTELNKIGIIGAVGIDYDNGQYKLTFEINRPRRLGNSKEGDEKKEPAAHIEIEGESLSEALQNAYSVFERELYWPNIKVYLLTEKAAKRGILTIFEFLERYPEPRLNVPVLITKNASISEIFNVKGNIEGTTSEYINSLLQGIQYNSKGVNVTLLDYMFVKPQSGREGTVGVIERIQKKPIILGTQKTDGINSYMLKLEGTGIFVNNYLKGFLNGNETRVLNYVNGKIKEDTITVKGPDDNNVITSVHVYNSNCKKEVSINGNDVNINLKIDLKAMQILEHTGKLKILDTKNIGKIEKLMSEKVKTEVKETIKRVQSELNSDIFGFGESVYFRNPKEWESLKENWNELFSKCKVNVEVKTQITRHGTIDEPIKHKEN